MARRDEVLKEMYTRMRAQAPKSMAICDLIRESLAAGKPLDLKPVDAILESIPAERRGITEFLVGKYLVGRGQVEAGRTYLRRVVDSPQTYVWARDISAQILRTTGKARTPR
jgi:hypothetical protein